MENTELKEKYCREFGYSYFNEHNENEYTKWLESKLLEALKPVKNNGGLDDVSNRRELLESFIDYAENETIRPISFIVNYIDDFLEDCNSY